MPYIKKALRKPLDPHIDRLAKAVIAVSAHDEREFSGSINYAVTRLLLKIFVLKFGKIRYYVINLVRGVVTNALLEFYRRVGGAYEDAGIMKDGDVDLYQQLTSDIRKKALGKHNKKGAGDARRQGKRI